MCLYPLVQSGLRLHWPTPSAALGAPRLDAGSAGTTNDNGAHRKVMGWPPPKATMDSSHVTAPATAPWPSPPSPGAAAQTPPSSPPPPPPLSAAADNTTEVEVEGRL